MRFQRIRAARSVWTRFAQVVVGMLASAAMLFAMVPTASADQGYDRPETARKVAVGQSVSASLVDDGDTDWYRVTVPSDGVFSLTFSNEQRDRGAWLMRLYFGNDSSDSLYSYDYGSAAATHDSTARIAVTKGTTFLVSVTSKTYFYTDARYGVKFNFQKASDWEHEPNDSVDKAQSLAPNTTINGTIYRDGGDEDWYRVQAPSSGVINLSFSNEQRGRGKWTVSLYGANVDDDFYHYDFDASKVTQDDTPRIGVPAGAYYVKVERPSYYWTDARYSLKFNFQKSSSWEREPNDSVDKAQSLAVNTTINGTIYRDGGDEDWYKVTVPAKNPVQVTFDNEQRERGSWRVTLYDLNLKDVVLDNFNAAQPSHALKRMTLPAGTYYVKVERPNYYWTDARYSLTVRYGAFFNDVNSESPHSADITWLANTGITEGYPDGSFGGMRTVVRQDMAAFLYRLAGSPKYTPSEADKHRFRDVNDNTPHHDEIWWLASTGISEGYPDGSFGGMRTVVRQDMAAFLYRYASYEKAKAPTGAAANFKDVGSSTPHRTEIVWLSRTGVTEGYPDGTFGGMRDVVRQDMAAFLHRMQTNVLK